MKKIYFLLSLFIFFPLSVAFAEPPEAEVSYKNPTLSGLFSMVIPGSGHMYQGKWTKGLLFTSTEAALLAGALTTKSIRTGNNLFNLFQNEHFYNIYSAFQDARIGNKNRGRMTDIGDQSLVDLLKAPFNPEMLSRWTFLLPTGVALSWVTYVAIRESKKHHTSNEPFKYWAPPLLAGQSTAIGIGEESFFRGYLQPEFTELFRNEWAGIVTQAAIFGLAHFPGSNLPRKSKWIPVIFTGLFGIYDGWVAKRNHYDLQENVAAHMWWDTIIFLGSYAIHRDGDPFILSFSLPF